MTKPPSPFDPVSLSRSVPRYTSYPTAPHFTENVDDAIYAQWLRDTPAATALSLYVHVPFCRELCWFCACRTQGVRRREPVRRYLDTLEAEIESVGALLGPAHPVTQVHWGGGSPTILTPDEVLRLRRMLVERFPGVLGAEFAVEIDPRDVDAARLDALVEAGLSRASIGVQDFDPAVQRAIGRLQDATLTRGVIEGLRARGVAGINLDLVYGLPRQTEESLARTLAEVVDLAPERVAIYGYAHVPWMARRQKMIDADTLPDIPARRAMAGLAARTLAAAGYVAVGIDHFALPGDSLARAAAEGTLQRNFQGYTDDGAEALIGFGASAIGRLPQGYVQNTPATAEYHKAIASGRLATYRGRSLTLADRVRRDAIEQILCGFALDAEALAARYGDFAGPVAAIATALRLRAPEGAVTEWRGGFRIAPAWRAHARLIAAEFDEYFGGATDRHSAAI